MERSFKCPWCGVAMTMWIDTIENGCIAGNCYRAYYMCPNCYAHTPISKEYASITNARLMAYELACKAFAEEERIRSR